MSQLPGEDTTKGIDFQCNGWRVQINIHGHHQYLGRYKTKKEAIEARQIAESICGKPKRGVPKWELSRILIDGELAFIELFNRAGKDAWAIIDSEDVSKAEGQRWWKDRGYAVTGRNILLHRVVMGLDDEALDIDHLDRNPSNNRKRNLRICTHSQNMHNKPPRWNNTTGINGVRWDTRTKSYEAQISIEGKRHHLGHYASVEGATVARKQAEQRFGVAL